MTTSPSNSQGFTLIEVLAAMVIMMIGLLGMLQSINVAITHDLRNQMRNEAVAVADDYLRQSILAGFDSISTTHPQKPNFRPVLRGAPRDFTLERRVTALSDRTKAVVVGVHWAYKNISAAHCVSTVVHQ